MPLYATLLRGVNVGGRKLPMVDLREILVSLGYDDVVTYVQSGNAVLSTRRRASRIGPEIEERLAADFSMDVPVIVRTHAELIGTLEANPFVGHTDPARLHVTFLAESPPAAGLLGHRVRPLRPRRVARRRTGRLSPLPAGLWRDQAQQRILGAPAGDRGHDAQLEDRRRNWRS